MHDLRVVVLGCGPAGLIAAHAAAMEGADVRILSKKRKSFMKGAQYLHAPIPVMTPPDSEFTVLYNLIGTEDGYREKVYGKAWDGTVSPEDLEKTHAAWDIRQTYDALWDVYGSYVREFDVKPGMVGVLLEGWKPDITISSVPAPLLCAEGHTFGATNIWSTDQAMHGTFGDNVVILSGEESPRWYRSAMIQGWGTTEWPGSTRPPLNSERLWEVPKPLKHNCSCFPDVVRVGRYGKWTKGVLSHEAFGEVQELCRVASTR